MTQFIWRGDDHVIAIDRGVDGTTFVEAKVRPNGTVEIVDMYTLDAEQSLNSPAEKV